MIDRTYCQTMASYNQWMNQKLYAICAELSDADRRADRKAFFGSIHGTLNHLLFGDRIWIGRFTGNPFTASVGQELYEDFDELRRERQLSDRQIIEWADTLSEDWLANPFEYHSKIYRKTLTLPAWVLVTHLFNHQTHHRGQLTTLLSQMGLDPGITDLPLMPDFNF